MTMPRRTAISTVAATWAALAITACGARPGASGFFGGFIGSANAAGQACDPNLANEGCHFPTGDVLGVRMACTADGTWQQLAACAQGTSCLESVDPAAAGTAKKVTECKDMVGSPDSASSADGDTSGADGTSIAEDGGASSAHDASSDANDTASADATVDGDSSGDDAASGPGWLECAKAACPAEWEKCWSSGSSCKTTAKCMDACNYDEWCFELCKNDSGSGGTYIVSLHVCAKKQGCG
jgi:hypothetical protein